MNKAEHQDQIEDIEDQDQAPSDEGVLDSGVSDAADGQESAEDRARRMGWKPQSEYKGKDDWVDADTFLENAEADTPQLRKTLRIIERNYQKLEKSTEAILEHQKRQLEEESKKAYAQAVKDIEARLSQAVEDGDHETIKKTLRARDEIKEQQYKAEAPKAAPTEGKPEVDDWVKRNPWFTKDPVLAKAAADYTNILANEGKSTAEQLAGAEAYVRETFPHKFRQPKQAPTMPGGGNNHNQGGRTTPFSYDDLTNEGRAECDRAIKGSDGKITKDDWLAYAKADPSLFKSQNRN